MGDAGRARVRASYTKATMIDSYRALYHEAVALMAGIGWKLERMLEQGHARVDDAGVPDGRRGDLGAVAAHDRPCSSRCACSRAATSRSSSARVELLITIAYAVTLVLSAPIHVVVSRYAADRLYARRLELDRCIRCGAR